jgi:hypothetical protein
MDAQILMRADPAQRHSDTAVVERQLSLLERAASPARR